MERTGLICSSFGFANSALHAYIGLLDEVFHLALFQKLDGSTEHAELFQSCHIDAVVIRISDLRGTETTDNLLGMQTVEGCENTFQGCSAHDTIIDDDKIIHIRL